MIPRKRRRYALVVISCLACFACTEDDTSDSGTSRVDQEQFLQNTSDLITKEYLQLKEEAEELSLLLDSLGMQPSLQRLQAAKMQLKKTWLQWQNVSYFELGPAENSSLRSSINIYKTDTTQIEQNIASGNYNLDQVAMKDAKGFPALDYLLNAYEESLVINKIQQQTNRVQYLQAVVSDLRSKVSEVSNAWGTYKGEFDRNTGTDVGSSTGALVNALNQHHERFFRDNKIGIPLGVRSAGIARPDFVEAFYGNYSLELAVANFSAMKQLYLGKNGYGLDDYLKALGAEELNLSIVNQINAIELKLNALTDPLEDQILSNSAAVQQAYNEIQKLIVLWKVDMPSRMGILITYQDNDGD